MEYKNRSANDLYIIMQTKQHELFLADADRRRRLEAEVREIRDILKEKGFLN